MSGQKLIYGQMVEAALRTVVRDVLARLENGEVPEPHHFYITFDTSASGVKISPRMREKYPEEMTIVVQHQFWDLKTTETSFQNWKLGFGCRRNGII